MGVEDCLWEAVRPLVAYASFLFTKQKRDAEDPQLSFSPEPSIPTLPVLDEPSVPHPGDPRGGDGPTPRPGSRQPGVEGVDISPECSGYDIHPDDPIPTPVTHVISGCGRSLDVKMGM